MPTVLVIRSITPMTTAALEIAVLKIAISWRTWASMLVILAGAVCYLIQDFQPSLPGYIWMGVNLVAASSYHVYVKWAIVNIKLSTMDMTIFNNALSLPFFLVASLIDRPLEIPTGVAAMSSLDWGMVLASCVVAAVISFTGFGLQAAVSATTASLVNHVNKVLIFILSFIIFQDPFNGWMIAGIVATVAGGIWYSYEQISGKKPNSLKPVSAKVGDEGKKEPTEGTRLTDDSEPVKPASSCWQACVVS